MKLRQKFSNFMVMNTLIHLKKNLRQEAVLRLGWAYYLPQVSQPLPFKLLTISSGIIHFNLMTFIFICIATRGLRFFLVAYLTYKFGQKNWSLLR